MKIEKEPFIEESKNEYIYEDMVKTKDKLIKEDFFFFRFGFEFRIISFAFGLFNIL